MWMKHLSWGLLLLWAAGCNYGIAGNGTVVDETREVGTFESVSVGSGLRAVLTVGAPQVVVRMDQNLQQHVETLVEGGALRVRTPPGVGIRPSAGTEIQISAPNVHALEASGGAHFVAQVSPSSTFAVDGSGGARIEVTAIETSTATVGLSGGAVAILAGTAQQLTVDASGGSRLEGELVSQNATVTGSGGSRVTVTATSSLQGNLSGGSHLTVRGAPQTRTVESSGGSTVTYDE